jgi:arsenate reductase (thioredoxin)
MEERVMTKSKVLFVCVHNSARSQMAEEMLRLMAGDRFEVESAGLEPGTINPYVVEVMKDYGIDLSAKRTQDVFEMFKQGKVFHYVITVCDESQGERCPVFPSALKRVHWSFRDPSSFAGSHEEIVEEVRRVREEIRGKLREWILQTAGEV